LLFPRLLQDGYLDTFDIDIVIGKKHYYIWNPDPTPTSGADCHTRLGNLSYAGDYGTTLAPDLTLYQAVLVFVGIYSNNYIIGASSAEAAALVDFLENQEGRMYLEGGDVWYYDPLNQGGYDFGPLFGINATSDGASDGGPFAGQTGTFTTGMYFAYAGENNWIDRISPTATGFLIFYDTDNAYDAGVANDAGPYRTCGGIRVMNIRYQVASVSDISLCVYDAAGRLVRTVVKGKCEPGYYTHVWDSRDDLGRKVPAGVYFVRFQTDDYQKTEKAILLR
jgi:hypothetical protein